MKNSKPFGVFGDGEEKHHFFSVPKNHQKTLKFYVNRDIIHANELMFLCNKVGEKHDSKEKKGGRKAMKKNRIAFIAGIILAIAVIAVVIWMIAKVTTDIQKNEENASGIWSGNSIETPADFWKAETFTPGLHKLSDSISVGVNEDGTAEIYKYDEKIKDVSHPVLIDDQLYYEEDNFIYKLDINYPVEADLVMDSCIPYGYDVTIIHANEKFAFVKVNNSTQYILFVEGEYVASTFAEEELEFYSSSYENYDYAISPNNNLYKVIIGKEPYTLRFVKIADHVESIETTEAFQIVMEPEQCCFVKRGGTTLVEYQKDGTNFLVVPANGATLENEGIHGIEHPIGKEIDYKSVEAVPENYDYFEFSRVDKCLGIQYGIVINQDFRFISKVMPEDTILRNYIPYIEGYRKILDGEETNLETVSLFQELNKFHRVDDKEKIIDQMNKIFLEYEENHVEDIKRVLLSDEGESILTYHKWNHISGKWGVVEFLEEHPEIEVPEKYSYWSGIGKAGENVEPITTSKEFWAALPLTSGKYRITKGMEIEVREDGTGDIYEYGEIIFENISHPVSDKECNLYFEHKEYIYRLYEEEDGLRITRIMKANPK